MGIAQHSFNVQVSGKSVQWHLFDVGGARGQRHTWIPYFDDANAIIFLLSYSIVSKLYSGHVASLNSLLVLSHTLDSPSISCFLPKMLLRS